MCSLFKTLLSHHLEPGLGQLLGFSGSVGSRGEGCWVPMGAVPAGPLRREDSREPVARGVPCPTGPCAQPLCPPPPAAFPRHFLFRLCLIHAGSDVLQK